MTHPVYRISQLLDEADRLNQKLSALDHRNPGKPAPDYTPHVATYSQWMVASRAMLPADLIDRWTAAFKMERQGVTLAQLMNDPTLTPPKGVPSLSLFMRLVLGEQVKLLEVARFRAWPAPSAIPEPTRYTIAQLLASLARWGISDHTLLVHNGADPVWRMRPRKPDPTQGVEQAMGWLDGMLVAARDQELPILQGALLDVTRHPKVPEAPRDEARVLLDQLALVGAAGQVPPAATDEVLRQLTALQQEVRALRDRVQALEGQQTL